MLSSRFYSGAWIQVSEKTSSRQFVNEGNSPPTALGAALHRCAGLHPVQR
jgi:hypothetical protein